jgi:hypothetical protein
VILGINRSVAVQVRPLHFNRDRGLIDAVGVVGRFQWRPAALDQLGSIPFDPMKDRGVIDLHATVPQSFFDLTIAQGIPQIPSHRTEDDVGFKVALF